MSDRRMTYYEGRPLPAPALDLEDQGLHFDIGTLFSRRRMFTVLGLGAATAGLAACAGPTTTGSTTLASTTGSTAPSGAPDALAEIPDETAGPFPGDGSNGPDVLEQSGIVRSDIRSGFDGAGGTAEGVPVTVELTVVDLANGGRPFQNAAVYVWHCDREGRYSMYSSGVENENYLRGVQVVDSAGKVRFTSIFPACYPGRWPHVHFEVYPDQSSITDAANAIATSQIALPGNVADAVFAQPGYEASIANFASMSLATDNVFGDDSGASQLATVSGDVATGYLVTLTVGIDTGTVPAAGGDMPPPGGGFPGGPPPR